MLSAAHGDLSDRYTSLQPDMEKKLHMRVIRGPDWSHQDQDGGPGHVGTVIGVKDILHPGYAEGTTLVQWDNGNKGLYKTGLDKTFELRIYESGPAGKFHLGVWCDGCTKYKDVIWGIRWRCTECFGIDLCTECYMSDNHDVTHVFMRVQSSERSSTGPKMLPRKVSHHNTVKGIFAGSRVVLYPNWHGRISGSEPGRVVSIDPSTDDVSKEEVLVEFGSGLRSRLPCGRLELACTLAGSGGEVYMGHLPILGDEETVDVGDRVVVSAARGELEDLQTRRGLWEHDQSDRPRKNGTVVERTGSGDFVVKFNDTEEVKTVNPSALRKVFNLCTGQMVKISDDIEMVKRLQSGYGGWNVHMKSAIGKTCRVTRVDCLDIHVMINDKQKFIFNSACLTPTEAPLPPLIEEMREDDPEWTKRFPEPVNRLSYAADTGDIDLIDLILTEHPHLVNYEPVPGRSILPYAAERCDVGVVTLLVMYGANVEAVDAFGTTPLMNAVNGNKYNNVKYLLEQGANVNALNIDGVSCLYVAANKGFTECAKYLLQHGADVNLNVMKEMSFFPLMESVGIHSIEIFDMLIARTDTDLKCVDKKTLTSAVHLAVIMSNTYALRKLLEKVPKLADRRLAGVGFTALMIAARQNATEAAGLLLKTGHCNVNAVDLGKGLTPLHIALDITSFNLAMVEVLIRNGANPNISDKDAFTPIEMAIKCHKHVDFMPANGTYPFLTEMKDKWKSLGIRTNGEALVAYLVWKGADFDVSCHGDVLLPRMFIPSSDPIATAMIEIKKQRGKALTKRRSSGQQTIANGGRTTHRRSTTDPSLGATNLQSSKRGNGKSHHRLSASPHDDRTSRNKNTGQRKSQVATTKSKDIMDIDSDSSDDSEHDEDKIRELQAKLQAKDRELTRLRQKAQRLEHLIHKKLSFSCGHELVISIADLMPECPICSGPICGVADLMEDEFST